MTIAVDWDVIPQTKQTLFLVSYTFSALATYINHHKEKIPGALLMGSVFFFSE